MRKRALARKQVNHDDMWITLPQKVSPDAPEVAEAAVRTEQPTYEDNWYRVLRTRDEPGAEATAPADAPAARPEDEAPETTAEAPDRGARTEDAAPEAAQPEPEPEVAPRAEDEVPARPDLAPQVASSLD